MKATTTVVQLKKKLVRKSLTGRTREKDAVILLNGIPSDNNSQDTAIGRADEKLVKYINDKLCQDIFALVAKYKEIEELPLTKIILDFGNTDNKAQDNRSLALPDPKLSSELAFLPEDPRWTIDQVVLPPSTRNQLLVVMNLIKKHHLMYNEWNLGSIMKSTSSTLTLNFYGKSGTGKTLAAEAVAHYLGKKIIRVNYSELESQYVGVTNKNLVKVFREASERDCVLFFDEADSILGRRLMNITQAAGHGINMARSVMLMELERFDGVVIFATNLISNFDTAFARRILNNVKFDLPDLENRIEILNIHIPKELPLDEDISIESIARQTEELSGGDLRNTVLKAAVKAASSESQKATKSHFSESINEIKEARDSMSIRSTGPEWLQSKITEGKGKSD